MAIDLTTYRSLFYPSLCGWIGRHARDPLHPCYEADFDIWVDFATGDVVVQADWFDGTHHEARFNPGALHKDHLIPAFRHAMRSICPEHVFQDETVVAYDDSGWTMTGRLEDTVLYVRPPSPHTDECAPSEVKPLKKPQKERNRANGIRGLRGRP